MELKSDMTELAGGRFDGVSQRISQETRNMRSISTFFQTVRRELELFAKGVQKAAAVARTQQSTSVEDSWTAALSLSLKSVDDFARLVSNTAQALTFKIVEPLENFIGHYEQSSKNFIRETSKIVESLALQRSKLKKARERCEKAATDEDAAAEEYRVQAGTLNAFIDEHEPLYRSKVLLLLQNEDNRVDFERKLFGMFVSSTEEIATSFLDSSLSVKKALAEVRSSAETDGAEIGRLPIFEKATLEETAAPQQELVRKHSADEGSSHSAPTLSISSVESVTSELDGELAANIVISTEDEKFMRGLFSRLLEGVPACEPDKKRMFDLFQYSDGRRKFAMLLYELNHGIDVPNYSAFKTIGEIVNDMLTNFSLYNDSNISYLCAVLSAGGQVASFAQGEEDDHSHYLRDLISENGIWQSKERWLSIFQCRVDLSILQMQSRPGPPAQPGAKPTAGIVQKLLSAGAKLIGKRGGKEAAVEKEEANRRAVVYAELGVVAIELALMNVDTDIGLDVLVHFALTYNIDSDKLFQLLSDYGSSQPLPREKEPGARDEARVSLAKREKEMKKFGYSKQTMVMGLAIKYINDPKTLSRVLLVSKEWFGVFKPLVYKIVLSWAPNPKKYPIWRIILTTQGFDTLYQKLKKESMADFIKSRREVDDVIKLDVIRSFHVYAEPEQEVLPELYSCAE